MVWPDQYGAIFHNQSFLSQIAECEAHFSLARLIAARLHLGENFLPNLSGGHAVATPMENGVVQAHKIYSHVFDWLSKGQ